jgi:hypothetical protein
MMTRKKTESVFLWKDYNKKQAIKGKEVDQLQHPDPQPTPMIIITTLSKMDIFHW